MADSRSVDAPREERSPLQAGTAAAPAASRRSRTLQLVRDRVAAPGLRPFWTLVGIRVAFWLGTTLTLLWHRLTLEPTRQHVPPFEAYESRTDLVFGTFAQWDSGWYLNIAEHGYRGEQAAAFFPFFPLVVRLVAIPLRSPLVAGVLVALVAAGIAAVLLERLGRTILGPGEARDGVLYLALYPIAFVFTAVHPEGLFLALAIGSVLAALRERIWLAALLAALAVATRPVGLALLPPLALLLWRGRSPRALARLAPLALVPVPIALFALHLERVLGDAGAFYRAQGTYWLRHTPPFGPLGGLWEALSQAYHGTARVLLHLPRRSMVEWSDSFGTLNALHFLLLVAALALTWVAWRRLGAALGLYSAAYLAIVLSSPAEGFPLVSLPRFLIGDFPLFLALASLTVSRPTARQIVLTTLAAVGAVAAVAFSRHIWVA